MTDGTDGTERYAASGPVAAPGRHRPRQVLFVPPLALMVVVGIALAGGHGESPVVEGPPSPSGPSVAVAGSSTAAAAASSTARTAAQSASGPVAPVAHSASGAVAAIRPIPARLEPGPRGRRPLVDPYDP